MFDQLVGRKTSFRYRVNSETKCPFVLPVTEDFGPARIKDISCESVGFIISHPVEPETVLVVGLVNESEEYLRAVLVQVVHCSKMVGGSYHVEGTFLTRLTYEELRLFLM